MGATGVELLKGEANIATEFEAHHRRLIIAGTIGNVLEWYDFAVYGFFAHEIGQVFFPSSDPVTSLIAAFGAFAAGFMMRPFGAVVFGHIADCRGRRTAMTLSVHGDSDILYWHSSGISNFGLIRGSHSGTDAHASGDVGWR